MPKAALPFGASTILERLIETLTGAFAEIILVAAPLSDEPFSIDRTLNHRADLIIDSAASTLTPPEENLKYRTNLTIERDDDAFAGPVGALRRGLARARGDVAFACSCDLPLLRAEVAVALCAMLDGRAAILVREATIAELDPRSQPYDAAIPSIEGFPQPLCAAYRREAAVAALLAMEVAGERRLTALAHRLNTRPIDDTALRTIDPDLRSFLNVNTAEDYARALRLTRTD